MAEKTSSVQSVDRVLDILEELSSAPQGMNLSDLAEATHLHVSTTHRLVGALVDRGYARKDKNSGKYLLPKFTVDNMWIIDYKHPVLEINIDK